MSTISRPSTFTSAAGILSWMLNLATRMLARMPQHARTAAALHRRLRVRACAGGRDQGRSNALPDPSVASSAELVPHAGTLIHPSPDKEKLP